MLKSHLRITRFATATFQFKKNHKKTMCTFLLNIVNTCFIRQSLHTFISSPELKAQVSFSDRFLSVVRLSVVWRLSSVCRLSVCRLSVNFSHF